MDKFDGLWTEDRLKELVIAHKNRSHSETADILSKKWNVFVSRDSVKNKMGRLGDGSEKRPNSEPLYSRDFFSKKRSEEGSSSKKTYFVTSAIAGCGLNSLFAKSIKRFLQHRGAELIVLPMRGIASKDEEFDKNVLDFCGENVYTEFTFNSNLEAFDIELNPTQVDPLVGLSRLAQKKSSLIVASPKQMMRTIPVSNVGIPHIICSTGAVTDPLYSSNRVGSISKQDHIIGGLIVEISNDTIFHIRQVQADEDGSFFDLNFKYTNTSVVKEKAEAFIMGDLHLGSEDETAMRSWVEVIKLTQPKYCVLHDIFDSRSISHHDEFNLKAKASLKEPYKFLKMELENMGSWLSKWSKLFPKMTTLISRSNHDEHVDRYLTEGRFVKDPHNYRQALELAIYHCDGLNPLKQWFETRFKCINVKWFGANDDFKVAGIQLAAHGHRGPNGSKGTVVGMENAYYKSVTAHLHQPSILRGSWVVGTSTKFRLGYTSGPSSWLHCSCLVYRNGMRQLVISINGEWNNHK
jgi:hypothetical protein